MNLLFLVEFYFVRVNSPKKPSCVLTVSTKRDVLQNNLTQKVLVLKKIGGFFVFLF